MARVTSRSWAEQKLAAAAINHSDELSVADLIYFFLGLLMTALVIVNDWPAVISVLMWGRA